MATRTDRLNEILRGLRVSSPDIIGAAVCNLEGFVIAFMAPSEIDEDLVGGMAASLLGVGERIASELMRSNMEQTFVKSDKGYVILNAIGADTVLVLLVTKEAKLGLIFLELKRAVPELLKAV